MIVGSSKILECNHCEKQVDEPTYLSWNTVGSIRWSDGKMESPMAPDGLLLKKCGHCGNIVWLKDLRVLFDPRDKTDSEAENKSWHAKANSAPSFEDYIAYLAVSNDSSRAFYVRLHGWWAGNDRRRGDAKFSELSDAESDNLRAFVLLLDEGREDQRILKAEGLRELGDFSMAKKLLDASYSKELREIAGILLEQTEQENRAVIRI